MRGALELGKRPFARCLHQPIDDWTVETDFSEPLANGCQILAESENFCDAIEFFRRLEQRVPRPRAQHLPQDTSSEGRLSLSRGDIEPFAVACNCGKSCVWIKIEVLAQCLVGIALLLAKFFQH